MFITFEGIEGSGKTTQIQRAARIFKNQGQTCVITREPGGTAIGGKIRAILLDPENEGIDPLTEVLLYTADRAQHLKEIIMPSLAEGKVVLCDRYFDATVVYQGFARGIDINVIRDVHRAFLKDFKPDITILLDLSPEMGLSRAWEQIENGARSGNETRFEHEALPFHNKVREGYLELARLEPSRFRIIDASQDLEAVGRDIMQMISTEIR
jgi:dTMP kinase